MRKSGVGTTHSDTPWSKRPYLKASGAEMSKRIEESQTQKGGCPLLLLAAARVVSDGGQF